jgi:hypothetical protein
LKLRSLRASQRPPLAARRCLACGAHTSYVELIVQIAETARQRSQAMLEEIRRKRAR